MLCGKKPCGGPGCVDDGEKPVAPPCVEVGELRFVISGFISGGDGILDVMELTDGMGLSMVDSIESENIFWKYIIPVAVRFKNLSTEPFSSCNLKNVHYLLYTKRDPVAVQPESIPQVSFFPSKGIVKILLKTWYKQITGVWSNGVRWIRLAIVFVNWKIVISTAVKIHFHVHLDTDLFHNAQFIILITISKKFQEI